ncbi:metal-dependent hydrolase [Bacillus sp. MUM 13]|uniref:metal-dependent hydrolase n=1 Tax=Bacillus sp. MUM 13 TaxID=1678001 RepID=UPI003204E29F
MKKLNGTAHMVLGAAAGFACADSLQSTPAETMLLVGIGAAAGLMPDIDIDGKLSNKITFSHKLIRTIAQLLGFAMILYSSFNYAGNSRTIGIGAGIGILLLSAFITQRLMLTLTGIGVLLGGISLEENWLLLLGIFIILGSFVPHRSYTHSIIGLIFFGVISYKFEASVNIDGVFITCLAGYASHMAADMKILPFNKRGVKFFLPFSKKEF